MIPLQIMLLHELLLILLILALLPLVCGSILAYITVGIMRISHFVVIPSKRVALLVFQQFVLAFLATIALFCVEFLFRTLFDILTINIFTISVEAVIVEIVSIPVFWIRQLKPYYKTR